MGLQVSAPVYRLPSTINADALRMTTQFWGPGNNYFGVNPNLYSNFSIGPLNGNCEIYFVGVAFTYSLAGFIWVQQDATGGRTFNIAGVGGVTRMRDENLADLAINPAPNSVTRYAYMTYQVGSTYIFEITRAKLLVY